MDMDRGFKPRLLFIGNLKMTGKDSFFPVLEAALRGGVDAFLLREKEMEGRELLHLAIEARKVTRRARARLIVSDRVDIALLAEADGVHLPECSLRPSEVRRIESDRRPVLSPGRPLIVGRSVHSLSGAIEAAADGADYLMAGPVFETPGKGPPLGLEQFGTITGAVRIPVIAVGGIDISRIQEIRRAGIRSAACIRAIAVAPNPELATRRMMAD